MDSLSDLICVCRMKPEKSEKFACCFGEGFPAIGLCFRHPTGNYTLAIKLLFLVTSLNSCLKLRLHRQVRKCASDCY